MKSWFFALGGGKKWVDSGLFQELNFDFVTNLDGSGFDHEAHCGPSGPEVQVGTRLEIPITQTQTVEICITFNAVASDHRDLRTVQKDTSIAEIFLLQSAPAEGRIEGQKNVEMV